jgi:nitrite reductase/ring-hydroxylating ferredoxin subunit
MGERVKIGSLTEVPPGTGRQVQVSGRAVAIYNVEGTMYAIDGACPHRGGPLGNGELKGNVVSCPWHRAPFDVITGAVLGPPAVQGVITHRATIEGGAIYVELAPEHDSSVAHPDGCTACP